MLLSEKTVEFTLSLQNSLNDHTFVKLSLGNYKGKEENLKNIYLTRYKLEQMVLSETLGKVNKIPSMNPYILIMVLLLNA